MMFPDVTINISVARYNELIKKEALFDELTKGKSVDVYAFDIPEEEKEND